MALDHESFAMISPKALAQKIPDLPRWVEARSLLLSGQGEILGLAESPTLSCIVRDPSPGGLLVVIGQPSLAAVQAALPQNVQGVALIAPLAEGDRLAPALAGWRRTRAILHLLQHPNRLPQTNPDQVRFLEPQTLRDQPIPPGLLAELESAAEETLIAATFVGQQPVSFCYAGSVTETLWDVSIDTLPEHRQRGYAALCSAFLIRYMQTQGQQPVWGAVEENPASWRLAQKLGFVAVDELVLFEPESAEEGTNI